MTYHNIEVIITKDEERVKLKGQVDNIFENENPIITIFEKEGNLRAIQTPPYSYSEKLSKFIEKIGNLQLAAYSMKEYRPRNFSININVGEAKE